MNDKIEYCLLSCILNEDDLYQRFKKYNNVFQDILAYKLYEIIIKLDSNNKQAILDYLYKTNEFESEKFIEIYTYYYNIDDFDKYLDRCLSNYFRAILLKKLKIFQLNMK